MHMWHPVASEEIGSRCEQFCVCYFPQLPTKYVPQEVSLEEIISWVFFTDKLHLTGMGCFSEVFWEENIFLDIVSWKQYIVSWKQYIVSWKQSSCDLCTSFAWCRVKRTIGRFQLEAPRAYQCKQILGLCQYQKMCIFFVWCISIPVLILVHLPKHFHEKFGDSYLVGINILLGCIIMSMNTKLTWLFI
jgi:hypothetical protein